MLHCKVNNCAYKALLDILTRKRKMKKILKSIYCVFESMGRARAASAFARRGNYKMAQQIMTGKCECC